jgi:hypothetical protein
MSQENSVAAESAPKRSGLKSFLYFLKLVVGNFLLFAVLIELVCVVYINVTDWHSSKPTYHVNYNNFWADINPDFGVWHRPNGHFYHQGGCFSVQYTTNSYGARDVERSVHSAKPRTVVLGDSMIEGLGLADQDRLTNILEKDTDREYLNFGTSGDFGPLQYAAMYKTMAAEFDHDRLFGVPDNDFTICRWSGARCHADRYRPTTPMIFPLFIRIMCSRRPARDSGTGSNPCCGRIWRRTTWGSFCIRACTGGRCRRIPATTIFTMWISRG